MHLAKVQWLACRQLHECMKPHSACCHDKISQIWSMAVGRPTINLSSSGNGQELVMLLSLSSGQHEQWHCLHSNASGNPLAQIESHNWLPGRPVCQTAPQWQLRQACKGPQAVQTHLSKQGGTIDRDRSTRSQAFPGAHLGPARKIVCQRSRGLHAALGRHVRPDWPLYHALVPCPHQEGR